MKSKWTVILKKKQQKQPNHPTPPELDPSPQPQGLNPREFVWKSGAVRTQPSSRL